MAFETTGVKVPKRILHTLLSALGAGVVPRSGAPYIAIGRNEEIASLLEDLSHVAEGGAACRFLVGRYGSGKSFLIQLIRGYALERGFLTVDADLSPERRLTGGTGAGLATYRELITNLSSKAAPEGGALSTMLSRHLTRHKQALIGEGILPEDERFSPALKTRVYADLSELEDEVGGFDFARILGEYYTASADGDTARMSACLRWLRGEYTTRTEAKSALGFSVSTIIGDDNWYSFIKLFSALAVRIGYAGLLVFIDECVNLYKIPNRISREANYEKILSIFNDTLQGRAPYLGVFFGGTPQFLEDTRRGLFSYDALKSRLEESRYGSMGYTTLSSPVIRLRRLSDNELLALVHRLTVLYMQSEGLQTPPLSDEQMQTFMTQSLRRAGAEEMITPREIIRDYLTLLHILRDNPEATFENLLSGLPSGMPKTESMTVPSAQSQEPTEKRKVTVFDIEL